MEPRMGAYIDPDYYCRCKGDLRGSMLVAGRGRNGALLSLDRYLGSGLRGLDIPAKL